jgi:UDP-N-acetylmuramoyl-tripeptide--D-alanyl-D-alanine ligase
MGVCKTVLEQLKDDDDFFIVEMGARRQGDIKFLAEFVGVDFGILTPIGSCHLETFGSLERIENTKYELCENAKKWVVFNGKSRSTKKLYQKFPRKKYLVCLPDSFAYAKNVRLSANGTTFDFYLDKNHFSCKTKLLGRANIDNVVLAGAIAFLLGESLSSIQNAIEKIEPTPHRMEFIKGRLVDVIDDSYNSNFEGFLQALKTLSHFSGRKIVVSPGMVELGSAQQKQNFLIGERVAKYADIFVIMNETNKASLLGGAKSGGMKTEQIFFANTRKEQAELLKRIIKKGDVVLFENDLPDSMK